MAVNRDLHVVVLMGGWSSEREVSLMSGKGVAAALRERGWSNVTEVDTEPIDWLCCVAPGTVLLTAIHTISQTTSVSSSGSRKRWRAASRA